MRLGMEGVNLDDKIAQSAYEALTAFKEKKELSDIQKKFVEDCENGQFKSRDDYPGVFSDKEN